MASDLGKKETPAPVCRQRPRKDFRGQRTQPELDFWKCKHERHVIPAGAGPSRPGTLECLDQELEKVG
jgi:hypothetical protein